VWITYLQYYVSVIRRLSREREIKPQILLVLVCKLCKCVVWLVSDCVMDDGDVGLCV